MNKFINLSPSATKGVEKPIFHNARRLRKDAILLAEVNKSYSSATSLLILSSEEIIKAILVLMHSEGYKVYLIEGSKKFFSDHKIRHQVAKLLDLMSTLFESMYIWEEQRENPEIKTKIKLLDGVLNFLNDVAKTISPFLNSAERIQLLQEFNDMKNNGFYVDYKDGLIIPKEQIQKEDFLKTKKVVDRLFKLSKAMKILFHESVEKHMSKQEANNTKAELKSVVNDLMKKVTVKELNKL